MAPAPTERLAIVAPELFVSDVDASIEFYQRLAARPCVRTPGARRRHFAVMQTGEIEMLLVHQHLALPPL